MNIERWWVRLRQAIVVPMVKVIERSPSTGGVKYGSASSEGIAKARFEEVIVFAGILTWNRNSIA